MKFAVSSCWNSHRQDDGYALLCELADLGFAYVELSHGTRMSLVPGILRGLDEGIIKVASIHNFCPLPVGVNGAAPNLYEPSAASRRERILWLHNTQKTIDFAERVECERIVIHSGQARFLFGDPEPAFERAYEADEGEKTAAFQAAREKGLKKVRRKKRAYMKRLKESYDLIAESAKDRGVKFGVENREGFTELPLDEEMAEFLETLQEHEIFGYWHDSGHAQLKDNMGLVDHKAFLENLRPRLLGFHLHDVVQDRDHQVPGTGDINWDTIAANVREGDVVVMEMSPRLKAEDIRQGREFLLRKIPVLGK